MLTAIEINDLWNQSKNPDDFARAIERAVLAKAGEQEPIYMWSLEDDGWMECTKAWFDSPMAEGYEKRIVYAHPLPAQAIPEGWKDEWKNNVMALWMLGRKHDSAIPDDQLDFMRDMLLSAPPKP